MEPVSEDWVRAVAVVAHPDDLEYGAASAVARWTSQGKEVSYVLATSGEAGMAGMAPDEAGALREEEQRWSAQVVGVATVERHFVAHHRRLALNLARGFIVALDVAATGRRPRLRAGCVLHR